MNNSVEPDQTYKLITTNNDGHTTVEYKVQQLEARVNSFLKENKDFSVFDAPFQLGDAFVQVCVRYIV